MATYVRVTVYNGTTEFEFDIQYEHEQVNWTRFGVFSEKDPPLRIWKYESLRVDISSTDEQWKIRVGKENKLLPRNGKCTKHVRPAESLFIFFEATGRQMDFAVKIENLTHALKAKHKLVPNRGITAPQLALLANTATVHAAQALRCA